MEEVEVGRKPVVPKFTPRGDWIAEILDRVASTVEGGEEPVEEVLNEAGEVVTPARRGKKGKRVILVNALEDLARENYLEVRGYPNPGMARMNYGNKLRRAAKARHGLYVNGEWQQAPESFIGDSVRSETEQGEKIRPVKEPKEPESAAA